MVNTAGGIVIAVVVLLVAAAVGWIVFTQLRARRLGLPPPSLASYLPWKKSENAYGPPRPAPGGVVGWFNDQIRKFKNRNNRSATGAYEQPLQGGAQRRGFGPLDPDEAWDARVGNEADQYGYYEEREMTSGRGGRAAPGQQQQTGTEYAGGGGSYNMNLAGPYGRDGGDDDHDEERGRRPGGGKGANPFDDDMAASLRGVSPRPMDGGAHDRPSLEGRRSAFREDV